MSISDRAGAIYDVIIQDRTSWRSAASSASSLPMHGAHNVQNSLAPSAVAHEMGIGDEIIRKGLGSFAGVKRRQ